MMKKQDCPCYDCENRSSICHSQCEEYKAYKKAKKETKEKILAKKAERKLVNEYVLKTINKQQHKKPKMI